MKEREARRIVKARSEGRCEMCTVAQATDYQHRKNRSQGGQWAPSNALHLCHVCHMWIHGNPTRANELGLYLRSWQDPAIEPVTLGLCLFVLSDDGTYVNAMKPRRIQMTRQHPWQDKSNPAVCVDRRGKWGNWFQVLRRGKAWIVVDDNGVDYPTLGDSKAAATVTAVELHRRDIEWGTARVTVAEILAELAGRDVACWCGIDAACHGDVLLEIANGDAS